MATQNHLQSLALKEPDRGVYLLERDTPGRGYNPDLVSFLQKRGLNHTPKIRKISEQVPMSFL